jgi:hypothetical protein
MNAALPPASLTRSKLLRELLVVEPRLRRMGSLPFFPKQRKKTILCMVFFLWLGERLIFQTFEELDSIPDKETELKEIRDLLDDNTTPHKEEM